LVHPPDIRARAAELTERLGQWLISSALPLWASVGFDPAHGRFCERLDFAGRPVEAVPHRAMVQARQIYVFARAAELGWFPAGAGLAETAMASLLRDFTDPAAKASGFAFSVDSEGRIVSEVRDAYAHAFVLFALAALHRLTGDNKLLAIADDTIAYIDHGLADPVYGGLFDAFPVTDRSKRQNPHMHLLEAYLALERTAPGRGYIDRATKLVALFENSLFSAEHRVLLEYFAEDWGPHPEAAKALLFEPGHHFEWIWLLREFEEIAGADLGRLLALLDSSARESGIGADGLVFDEVRAGGEVLKRSHRIWPHTEGAKAAVARLARADPEAPAFASMMVAALFENFLDRPFAGGWIDHVGEDLAPIVAFVPASSLYHIFFAATELARVFPSKLESQKPR
jgi:mannose/cellobiose epimerase-like protein (N-acyl-D-glucosamine 2-epimerase family)